MSEIIISPGTTDTTWETIEKKLESVKGISKTIHVDIVDGIFAPNKTFLDPKPFSQFKDDFLLEVHLMTENPLQYLKPFSDAGFKRFIGHVEKMPEIPAFVAEGQILGEVGLALDTPTEIDVLHGMDLTDLDQITIMTVKAGVSGQAFTPEMLDKVRKLRRQTEVPIEVDGGINDQTIIDAYKAGGRRLVSSSFIWNSNNPKSAFEKLRGMIEE